MRTWYRLCVDVSPSGRPLGVSYEGHEANETTSVGTTDASDLTTLEDAIELAYEILQTSGRYQAELPF